MPIKTGILPAGSTLTVDYSIGETATISYQDGDIGVVDNGQTKTTDRTIGPFANDVAYSINYTGWPKAFTTAAGGSITTISLPLPDPASLPVGPATSNGKTGAVLQSNSSAFIGVLYRNNTPVSSANSVASNFQTPVAGFTVPAGAMDKDSTLIIDMTMRVFDTGSATRIVRVFADTQQVAAYSFTSTSGLIPMQFRMSNCGDAGAQLQSSGLTINGTEQATVSTRQIDTAGHDTEITITVETPSGQMIKQALFVELK